jgi:hypothetical protein
VSLKFSTSSTPIEGLSSFPFVGPFLFGFLYLPIFQPTSMCSSFKNVSIKFGLKEAPQKLFFPLHLILFCFDAHWIDLGPHEQGN